ncbi:MAG: hypothetical protein HXK27_04225 [Atopobium sp.]|mgnify:CR=1 FL=1|nr:hypothetical protein [Atopobium sp.]
MSTATAYAITNICQLLMSLVLGASLFWVDRVVDRLKASVLSAGMTRYSEDALSLSNVQLPNSELTDGQQNNTDGHEDDNGPLYDPDQK